MRMQLSYIILERNKIPFETAVCRIVAKFLPQANMHISMQRF